MKSSFLFAIFIELFWNSIDDSICEVAQFIGISRALMTAAVNHTDCSAGLDSDSRDLT